MLPGMSFQLFSGRQIPKTKNFPRKNLVFFDFSEKYQLSPSAPSQMTSLHDTSQRVRGHIGHIGRFYKDTRPGLTPHPVAEIPTARPPRPYSQLVDGLFQEQRPFHQGR